MPTTPNTGRTQVLSVHKFRRSARRKERQATAEIAGSRHKPVWTTPILAEKPSWATGARVEKAGRFSYAVVWTEWMGH